MLLKNETQCAEGEPPIKWASTKEAALYLRVSPNALRILVHREKVKAYKMGTRLRFKISDLGFLIKKEIM